MLTREWMIQAPNSECSLTQQPFAEGEMVYSILERVGQVFQRRDFSEKTWIEHAPDFKPLCFWKTAFKPPAPVQEETLKKNDAESLLRNLVKKDEPTTLNTRYILAAMLERKRILKQIEKIQENDKKVLVYEHATTGETFLIIDPQLQLDHLFEVQTEVAQLLTQATS
ncbi:MAG: hypothetical protein K1X66_08240 [Verrucomicrobiae bacterium]|nr:hypothetical protein [Verrucomicrobiae bacterium]